MKPSKAVIIMLVSAAACLAQSIHISGSVRDGSNGSAISGAEVYMLRSGLRGVSDQNGFFKVTSNSRASLTASSRIITLAQIINGWLLISINYFTRYATYAGDGIFRAVI